MTKKIEREFWVKNHLLRAMRDNTDWRYSQQELYTEPSGDFKNKITISWEEPEKKIAITEDEFENAFSTLFVPTYYEGSGWGLADNAVMKIKEQVKERLFGSNS